jgi:hypothetical protein
MRLISNKDIDKKEVLKQSRFKIFNSYYEYYPLILEFCFMTLFAFCVPFTPILLFITNNLEIRSDLIKVCFLTRRPEAIKKKNIGAWKYILEFIGIASIITNVMFCYIYNNKYAREAKRHTVAIRQRTTKCQQLRPGYTPGTRCQNNPYEYRTGNPIDPLTEIPAHTLAANKTADIGIRHYGTEKP